MSKERALRIQTALAIGAFIMTLSMAATSSPKLEIYYQLICTAMGPEVVGQGEADWMKQCHKSSEVSRAVTSLVSHRQANSRASDSLWPELVHRSSRRSQLTRLMSPQNTLLTLIMGCLSALTTGWWGSLSDRRGRKIVLVMAVLGFNLMDIVFLM